MEEIKMTGDEYLEMMEHLEGLKHSCEIFGEDQFNRDEPDRYPFAMMARICEKLAEDLCETKERSRLDSKTNVEAVE